MAKILQVLVLAALVACLYSLPLEDQPETTPHASSSSSESHESSESAERKTRSVEKDSSSTEKPKVGNDPLALPPPRHTRAAQRVGNSPLALPPRYNSGRPAVGNSRYALPPRQVGNYRYTRDTKVLPKLQTQEAKPQIQPTSSNNQPHPTVGEEKTRKVRDTNVPSVVGLQTTSTTTSPEQLPHTNLHQNLSSRPARDTQQQTKPAPSRGHTKDIPKSQVPQRHARQAEDTSSTTTTTTEDSSSHIQRVQPVPAVQKATVETSSTYRTPNF